MIYPLAKNNVIYRDSLILRKVHKRLCRKLKRRYDQYLIEKLETLQKVDPNVQLAFTCSNLTKETPEQCVNYVHS